MLWQLLLACILIALPVFMIFFNGARAIRGIFWNAPAERYLPQATRDLQRSAPPVFGVYDPGNVFQGDSNFHLQHVYISWIDPDTASIQKQLLQIIDTERRMPVITIEPWAHNNDTNTLLTDITSGKYDRNIDMLSALIARCPDPVYLIWGHEMDQDLAERYHWSGQDPAQYVAAYRYVHDRMKSRIRTTCYWIWSPVVKTGCARYWPGNDYADYIGMPVYTYPAWEYRYYGHLRSFRSWFDEKYRLVEHFEKPVIIVELGVTGSADFRAYWLQEAFETIHNRPSIAKVLFFHARDTEGAWGENLETPDWRTNPGVISGLVQWSLE